MEAGLGCPFVLLHTIMCQLRHEPLVSCELHHLLTCLPMAVPCI